VSRVAIAIALFVLWTGLVFWLGSAFTGRGADATASKKETAQAVAAVAQINEVRAEEHSQAAKLSAIGAKHEEDRAAASAIPDAVVAGLRAGTLQLRDDLATCSTARLSEAVAGTVERDAHAQLRASVAGAAVQIGRDADDHVKAGQAVIAADRAEVTQ